MWLVLGFWWWRTIPGATWRNVWRRLIPFYCASVCIFISSSFFLLILFFFHQDFIYCNKLQCQIIYSSDISSDDLGMDDKSIAGTAVHGAVLYRKPRTVPIHCSQRYKDHPGSTVCVDISDDQCNSHGNRLFFKKKHQSIVYSEMSWK